MNDPEEHDEAAGIADDAADDASPDDAVATPEGAPRRRRRRRRGRGRGAAEAGAVATDAPGDAAQVAAPVSSQPPRPQQQPARAPAPERRHDAPPAPRPPSRDAAAFASLTAGLFSHLDDRQVACKVDGCTRTWTWTAAEQIESFGQPPPKRMCAEHHAAMHTIEDREVRCSNPWCERTWTWTKSAQMGQLQHARGGASAQRAEQVPSRTCDHCQREERELVDAEISCRVDGCGNTWTWTRDAQLKHRAWMRHSTPASGATPGHEHDGGDRPRGKRRRRGRSHPPGGGRLGLDGPSPRMCESCRQRLNALVDRETTCKVHGCTRTVTIDRESQLRAWAAAGNEAVVAELALPKRMCEVCREFCRLHHDREVACSRRTASEPCDRTWTYKTGAQLQAFLAGRFEDPVRLCSSCVASGHARPDEGLEGVEIMPCIVQLCEGIWHYVVGMEIGPADDGDKPLDRMCNACRSERGASPRPLTQPPTASGDPSATARGDDPSGASDDEATTLADPFDPSSSRDPVPDKITDTSAGTESLEQGPPSA